MSFISIRTLTVLSAAIIVAGCKGERDGDAAALETTSEGEANISASADAAAERDRSMIRVVNTVDGGKDVIVKLDTMVLFSGVKATTVTDYREVTSNLGKFSISETGAAANTMLAENDEVLVDGNRYTVFVIAEDVARTMLRIVKDEVAPDSGMARIRVIHAAPGGPEFDVAAVGSEEKLFSGVNFKSEAGYKDVAPGSMTLEVRAKDAPKVLLKIPTVTLKRGTATTIVVTGSGKLSSFQFTDALMGPMSN